MPKQDSGGGVRITDKVVTDFYSDLVNTGIPLQDILNRLYGFRRAAEFLRGFDESGRGTINKLIRHLLEDFPVIESASGTRNHMDLF
jgi:hypothetical protein